MARGQGVLLGVNPQRLKQCLVQSRLLIIRSVNEVSRK